MILKLLSYVLFFVVLYPLGLVRKAYSRFGTKAHWAGSAWDR